jgi:hypothetical protein
MVKPPRSLQAFREALQKEKINLVIRENDKGIIYGMTYIDHKTKCVFNGSDIGKEYSAKSILDKCGITQTISEQEESIQPKISKAEKHELKPQLSEQHEQKLDLSRLFEEIIKPVEENNYLPYELRKQKKKKRKSN